MRKSDVIYAVIISLFSATLFSCSGKGLYEINLLPTPKIYSSGLVNPFTDNSSIDTLPYRGILYATDRQPAIEGGEENFYATDPGLVLRLGLGGLQVGEGGMTWAEAKRISLLKNRSRDYPIRVTSVEEFGILGRTANLFMDDALIPQISSQPAQRYAELINTKLAMSKKKDIYIYVHGYNTNFEDPLLVAGELWHYLGYEGVFIAYAWPATSRGLAYLGDLEKAKQSSRNLRLFLQYLSSETKVENIHVVGYSMGTRVTTYALTDLALLHAGQSAEEIRKKLRVGNVIIIGSDLSPLTFSNYIHDDILNVVRSFTIYTSASDSALGASTWLFDDRHRLGETVEDGEISASGLSYLRSTQKLSFIDVTEAEGSTSGNGHHYFRSSPWVSSDLLMNLMYGLPPKKRGLIRKGKFPIWRFPPDYIERLRASLGEVNPALAADKPAPK